MKAYKYKLKVSRRIAQEFERVRGVCCDLYNAGLQERRDAYRTAGKSVSYAEQCVELTDVRGFDSDVASVYSQVTQDALRRLDKAFLAFFRRVKAKQKAGYPRFRSKSRYDSFTYPQSGFRLDGDKLHLAKIGSARLRLSRPVEGRIKTCTIKREADGWYVIFAVEENSCRYLPKTGKHVGIDVGIESFATLSTGARIENPKYLRQAERRLKAAQRAVSRKKLRGSNRRKAVRLLARQHLKVKRQRLDFFHKRSLALIREFDGFVFEDLNVAGMVKNHRLAKAISDAAWNTFLRVHTGKAAEAGRVVRLVNPAFTSQDCSRCGARVHKRLAVREHRCESCSLVLHRDHNAAINIERRADALGMVGIS